MIFALEGPDKTGKTTVFSQLMRQHNHLGQYVPALPLPRELMPVMAHVELRSQHLWEHLYVPSQTYITDRFYAISGPVYDKLFGRVCKLNVDRWRYDLVVFRFVVPGDILAERHRRTPDEYIDVSRLEQLELLYDIALEGLKTELIDATWTTDKICEHIERKIRWYR